MKKNNKVAPIFIIITLSCLLSTMSLLMSTSIYNAEMFFNYFKMPLIFILNTLPVIGVMGLGVYITNSCGISYMMSSILILGGSFINYYKIQFRNDPFMYEDLQLVKEASKMIGNYKFFLNIELIIIIIFSLAIIIFAFRCVDIKVNRKVRLIGVTATVILLSIIVKIYPSQILYQRTQSPVLRDSGNQLEQFSSRGFVYPFLYTRKYNHVDKPSGYDKDLIKKELKTSGYENIPEEKKVNIIAVMLEAYNDFTKFSSVDFITDPYIEWKDLKSNAYSGEIVTNIFAGGTVDTERSFITGYKNLPNFRKKTLSYIDFFNEQGYVTEGVHPYYNWYYNRKNINANLGFQNYYFYEDAFYDQKIYLEAGEGLLPVISDNDFFSRIIDYYEKNKLTNKPYFNFSISLEMHGAYPTTILPQKKYLSNKEKYDESIYNMCNYYFQKVENTNFAISKFVDYFSNENKPTVIVFFGDHNPYLGENNIGYDMLGINLDTNTEEGFYNYYSVPYLVWGNEAAKTTLNKDIIGKGPTISSCFLMNELFNVLGLKGNEYLNATTKIYNNVQVIKPPFYKKDGKIVTKLSDKDLNVINLLEQLQYYQIYDSKTGGS